MISKYAKRIFWGLGLALGLGLIFQFSIGFLPTRLRVKIFPEYLEAETILTGNSLSSLNDDFAADSLDNHWTEYKLESVDVKLADAKLIMTPGAESVWWMKDSGPMIYKMVDGDFSFSTAVQTRKASDTSSYPDKAWQFGGLMLRDPSSETSGLENYVFIVVGYRGSKLQVEVKNTENSESKVAGIDWGSGDAELRISRKENTFYMMARKTSAQRWQVLEFYKRPDLPAQLQAAIIVYAFSYGEGIVDLTARFEDIKFWKSDFLP